MISVFLPGLGYHLLICVLGKIVIFLDIKTLFERSFFQLSIYRQLADAIVFQSDYSQRQCEEVLGESSARNIYKIVNGANRGYFYPSVKELCLGGEVKFITTGNFRNPDMLKPVIQALDAMKTPKRLTILGRVHSHLLECIERDYVTHLKEVSLPEVGHVLRHHNVFLYSHLNPPCPNSVIEAMSCGLPVVGFNSGSMQELCGFNADLLAPVSNRILQEYAEFDSNVLLEKIEFCLGSYPLFLERARENSDRFSLEKMTSRYITMFNEISQM